MPKQILSLPMVYINRLYRTIHDPNIRVPVWVRAAAPYSIQPVMAVVGQAPTWVDARTRGRINIRKSLVPSCIHLFDVIHPCSRPH
jgi:ribosomal protein L39E